MKVEGKSVAAGKFAIVGNGFNEFIVSSYLPPARRTRWLTVWTR